MFVLIVVMAALGALMFFAPHMCMKEEQRDDSENVAKVKKCGSAIMAFAALVLFLTLKYTLV